MTSPPVQPSASDPSSFDLDGAALQRMLELGVQESRRPLDAIVDRVGRADGDDWIRRALLRSPAGGLGDPHAMLVEGGATIEQLRDAAERCRTVEATPQSEAATGAMLGYFLTIAAALAHHGAKLTRRARPQIDESLLDLAAATPEPWRTLLCRAVDAPMTEPESP